MIVTGICKQLINFCHASEVPFRLAGGWSWWDLLWTAGRKWLLRTRGEDFVFAGFRWCHWKRSWSRNCLTSTLVGLLLHGFLFHGFLHSLPGINLDVPLILFLLLNNIFPEDHPIFHFRLELLDVFKILFRKFGYTFHNLILSQYKPIVFVFTVLVIFRFGFMSLKPVSKI
jgi:hypothetical protein